MKIALVIENFSPHRGGAEVHTLWLTRQLMAAGHDVTVLSEKCAYPDIKFQPVPVSGPIQALRALSFARNACRLVQAGSYDVTVDLGRSYGAMLHLTHNGCYPKAWRASLQAEPNPALRGLRWLGRVLSPRHWSFSFIERERVRRETHIIALSEWVAEGWRRYYGVPHERLHIVYNGVDVTRFQPRWIATSGRDAADVEKRPLTILCVANNFRLKGVNYLLRAARVLKETSQQPFRVRIVGLGFGSGPRCERLARELGLNDIVEFVGETKDIAKLYAEADVFCLPTFNDSCSLVLLEALAAGLPVVSTRCNGASELVTAGLEGFVLDDPRNVQALATTLAKFFDEPMRAQMAVAARALAERCTGERNFEQLLAVFRDVAGNAR